jgi:hypothetical protein
MLAEGLTADAFLSGKVETMSALRDLAPRLLVLAVMLAAVGFGAVACAPATPTLPEVDSAEQGADSHERKPERERLDTA